MISLCLIFQSCVSNNIAIAIGRSKRVPTFFVSEGARFSTIFFLGISSSQLRNVPLILSFASLIDASGKPIISIVGRALFVSASIVIFCAVSQIFVYVHIVCIKRLIK